MIELKQFMKGLSKALVYIFLCALFKNPKDHLFRAFFIDFSSAELFVKCYIGNITTKKIIKFLESRNSYTISVKISCQFNHQDTSYSDFSDAPFVILEIMNLKVPVVIFHCLWWEKVKAWIENAIQTVVHLDKW